MKFPFAILISVVLASFGTFLLVHLHFTGLLPWEERNQGDVITSTLQSGILHESREVMVTLPKNYSAQREYPVLYLLDGSSLQQRSVEILEVLADNGYGPETIVVGIPNSGREARQRDLTPPFMNTDIDDSTSAPGGGDKFLEFIQYELIPFIDGHYSTSNYRLIGGNSRGGLLVLYSLMAKPDLFQARFCYSTPFWRQDEIILRELKGFITPRDSLKTFLFFSAGEKETEKIRSGCRSLATRLTERAPDGMKWHYQFTPEADHQSNAVRSLGRALGLWGKYYQDQKIAARVNVVR